jgi:HAD superfamily phosphoserine phosphatase-like hydrolase
MSLVLDVDSTLSAVEGIDWLAGLRSDSVRQRVADVTDSAMRGKTSLGSVYAERLEAVRPTRAEVAALGRIYVKRIEPSAGRSLAKLTNIGTRIVLVTAGIRDAVLPLAAALGISESDVHAVTVHFDDSGEYVGFDTESPLTRNGGKATVVRALSLPRPSIAVGDGITDAELKTLEPRAVDTFVAYTGIVSRPPVTAVADYSIRSFDELVEIVAGCNESVFVAWQSEGESRSLSGRTLGGNVS